MELMKVLSLLLWSFTASVVSATREHSDTGNSKDVRTASIGKTANSKITVVGKVNEEVLEAPSSESVAYRKPIEQHKTLRSEVESKNIPLLEKADFFNNRASGNGTNSHALISALKGRNLAVASSKSIPILNAREIMYSPMTFTKFPRNTMPRFMGIWSVPPDVSLKMERNRDFNRPVTLTESRSVVNEPMRYVQTNYPPYVEEKQGRENLGPPRDRTPYTDGESSREEGYSRYEEDAGHKIPSNPYYRDTSSSSEGGYSSSEGNPGPGHSVHTETTHDYGRFLPEDYRSKIEKEAEEMIKRLKAQNATKNEKQTADEDEKRTPDDDSNYNYRYRQQPNRSFFHMGSHRRPGDKFRDPSSEHDSNEYPETTDGISRPINSHKFSTKHNYHNSARPVDSPRRPTPPTEDHPPEYSDEPLRYKNPKSTTAPYSQTPNYHNSARPVDSSRRPTPPTEDHPPEYPDEPWRYKSPESTRAPYSQPLNYHNSARPVDSLRQPTPLKEEHPPEYSDETWKYKNPESNRAPYSQPPNPTEIYQPHYSSAPKHPNRPQAPIQSFTSTEEYHSQRYPITPTEPVAPYSEKTFPSHTPPSKHTSAEEFQTQNYDAPRQPELYQQEAPVYNEDHVPSTTPQVKEGEILGNKEYFNSFPQLMEFYRSLGFYEPFNIDGMPEAFNSYFSRDNTYFKSPMPGEKVMTLLPPDMQEYSRRPRTYGEEQYPNLPKDEYQSDRPTSSENSYNDKVRVVNPEANHDYPHDRELKNQNHPSYSGRVKASSVRPRESVYTEYPQQPHDDFQDTRSTPVPQDGRSGTANINDDFSLPRIRKIPSNIQYRPVIPFVKERIINADLHFNLKPNYGKSSHKMSIRPEMNELTTEYQTQDDHREHFHPVVRKNRYNVPENFKILQPNEQQYDSKFPIEQHSMEGNAFRNENPSTPYSSDPYKSELNENSYHVSSETPYLPYSQWTSPSEAGFPTTAPKDQFVSESLISGEENAKFGNSKAKEQNSDMQQHKEEAFVPLKDTADNYDEQTVKSRPPIEEEHQKKSRKRSGRKSRRQKPKRKDPMKAQAATYRWGMEKHKDVDGFFQYANVPAAKLFEYGYRVGGPQHTRERHHKTEGNQSKIKVNWEDGNGDSGDHYWEFNHDSSENDESQDPKAKPREDTSEEESLELQQKEKNKDMT